MHLPDHHKIAAAFATYFCADKTFDVASEHLLLAAHETSTHLGLWGLTLPLAGTVIAAIAYVVHRASKGASNG